MADGCIDCVRKENQLDLKARDLRELEEERDYYRRQAEAAAQQAKQAQEPQPAKGHESLESLLACSNCGPRERERLPELIDKATAKRVTEKHFPGAFRPVAVPER